MSLLISLELQSSNFNLSIHTSLATQGFTGIYGHSGSGKTTLLRWLAGLEKSTPGQLTFQNKIWQDDNTFVPTQQRQIAYVFQDAHLFPHLNVQGNLDYAYHRRFNDNGPVMKQVCQWFELEGLLNNHTEKLSGGERQRVAMARALLSSPQLILMDEPLSSLDPHSKERILQHLETLHDQYPTPVFYVSHDLEEVSRLADQLLLLDNGAVSAQGSLLDLSTRLDLNLSHEENAASIIETTIKQHDNHYQLTELSITEQLPLFLTKTRGNIGDKVRVRIPARDVSITLKKPEKTSILNIIPGIIDEIESDEIESDKIENSKGSRALLRLKISEQFLLVRLTKKSIDRLQLQPGQHVYAQIKTVALLSDQNKQ
ncbi:MAG: molybdenum ABC transporter ATP-binding protein [Pseudomonadales bacterium]